MCLAVPGRIMEIREDRGTLMATIDFDGISKEICLAYLPDLEIGEYVIVHVGFAISRIDEDSAKETLAMFKELGILEEELAETTPTAPPDQASPSTQVSPPVPASAPTVET